jgi:type II secretory pathway pseudopilin PulG
MKLVPFLAGGVGGLCPYVIVVAKAFMTSKATTHFSDIISPWYYIGVMLLALIGAVVCLLFQEVDLRKAFVLGISAPALISNTLSNAEGSKNGLTAWALPNLITAAYAQNITTPATTPVASPVFGRYLDIALQTPVPINAEFLAAGGQTVLTAVLQDSTTRVPIPGLAQKIRFNLRGTESSVYSLPEKTGESAKFSVTVKGQRSFGIQQAWGAAPETTFKFNVQ